MVKLEIWNLKFEIWNLKLEIWNGETWNLKFAKIAKVFAAKVSALKVSNFLKK